MISIYNWSEMWWNGRNTYSQQFWAVLRPFDQGFMFTLEGGLKTYSLSLMGTNFLNEYYLLKA